MKVSILLINIYLCRVRILQNKIAYFLPFYLVLVGSLYCIKLDAQFVEADSLKPISNFKRWYQNILPTPYLGTINKSLMPMAVGYTNFDDNIRDLQ